MPNPVTCKSQWVSKGKCAQMNPASSWHYLPALYTGLWLNLINYNDLHMIVRHFWDISQEYPLMEKKEKFF